MTCDHCGVDLPSDALFCGECGRAVTGQSPRTVQSGLRPLTAPAPQPEPWKNSSAGTVCEQCGSPVTPDDIFCGECGFVVQRATPVPPGSADSDLSDPEDLEPTRLVARPLGGERFILQFSTGESFTVYGTGLMGRNPRPEPEEYFDQMVRISDASRSVSKTHLEFGQDSGHFWVQDRFSGNGTVLREPDTEPVRCRPGRRYRVSRGSRVEVGEQFFIVS